jgi:non-ribosomal peptide synthase protein (TIGR01720 family)
LYDVVFNYLGQLDNIAGEGRWLKGAAESSGLEVSALNGVDHKLSITGQVVGGALQMVWSYDGSRYSAATIETLSSAYMDHLEQIIGHCLEQERRYYTASDYGLSGSISYKELEAFLSSYESNETQDDLIL